MSEETSSAPNKVGPQQAAKITGRSKSTIIRAMQNGKISFEVDEQGHRVIDLSELERVFGKAEPFSNVKKSSGRASSNANVQAEIERELQRAQEMIENERMKMRMRMLEDQTHMLRQQLDDAMAQRDQWQKQAQQVLLTSQHSQKQADDLRAELETQKRQELERRKQMVERVKRIQGQNQNSPQKTQNAGGIWSELKKRWNGKA
ncbi:MAG: entry exclusion 1 domain-containing protein [Alphaproteobacteria bacterium]|nr:entry exclusion 1 domain-containing protein [Alphaproteobacteria bacterium]